VQLGRTSLRQRHQLRTPVLRIGPADNEAMLFKIGYVPAQDGSADTEPCGEVRGPGLPLPHEAEDALERHPGFLPAHVRDCNAADRSLEVEDLVDEIGRGFWCNCHAK
jgi:hypothetical protein